MGTKQITIRVDEALVDFVDELVSSGARSSRADAVSHALARERRHRTALQDLEIIRAYEGNPYPDLDGLAEWAAQQPLNID
jgi:Arc/MetJ-type ribon-helix-helix transcriptional regulator